MIQRNLKILPTNLRIIEKENMKKRKGFFIRKKKKKKKSTKKTKKARLFQFRCS